MFKVKAFRYMSIMSILSFNLLCQYIMYFFQSCFTPEKQPHHLDWVAALQKNIITLVDRVIFVKAQSSMLLYSEKLLWEKLSRGQKSIFCEINFREWVILNKNRRLNEIDFQCKYNDRRYNDRLKDNNYWRLNCFKIVLNYKEITE